LDYCNRIILPPVSSIVLYPNIPLETKPIEQTHQSPAPSHSVHPEIVYNFLNEPSSSSVAVLNIDLNKPPPDEKE